MSIQLIKDLRGVRVTIYHPPDEEGTNLARQLNRIGCVVNAKWPPPKSPDGRSSIILVAMAQDRRTDIMHLVRQLNREGRATLIAVVDYENPGALQMVLESEAYAVVEKPVRPFGLLTTLIIAQSLRRRQEELEEKIDKLDRKLSGQRKISQAKSILMKIHALSEDDAYRSIRAQAMSKRVSMEEIAVSIINANEILTFSKNNGPISET